MSWRHQTSGEAEQPLRTGIDAPISAGDQPGRDHPRRLAKTFALDSTPWPGDAWSRRPVACCTKSRAMRRVHDRSREVVGELGDARIDGHQPCVRFLACADVAGDVPTTSANAFGAVAFARCDHCSHTRRACSAIQARRLLRNPNARIHRQRRVSSRRRGDPRRKQRCRRRAIAVEVVLAQAAAAFAQRIGLRGAAAAERGGGGVGANRQCRHGGQRLR